jgi:hypothetical protein
MRCPARRRRGFGPLVPGVSQRHGPGVHHHQRRRNVYSDCLRIFRPEGTTEPQRRHECWTTQFSACRCETPATGVNQHQDLPVAGHPH